MIKINLYFIFFFFFILNQKLKRYKLHQRLWPCYFIHSKSRASSTGLQLKTGFNQTHKLYYSFRLNIKTYGFAKNHTVVSSRGRKVRFFHLVRGGWMDEWIPFFHRRFFPHNSINWNEIENLPLLLQNEALISFCYTSAPNH